MEKSESVGTELRVTERIHAHAGRIPRKWVLGVQIQMERGQTVHKYE